MNDERLALVNKIVDLNNLSVEAHLKVLKAMKESALYLEEYELLRKDWEYQMALFKERYGDE